MMARALKWASRFMPPCKEMATDCGSGTSKNGLVLGVYSSSGCTEELKLTPLASKVDKETGGKLKELIKVSDIKKGNARMFTNLSNEFYGIAVAGLGEEGLGWNEQESLDECKENIRIATAHGTKLLQDENIGNIKVEGFTNSEAASESAYLSVWRYQDLKQPDRQLTKPKLDHYEGNKEEWARGKMKAEAQNFARKIEDMPANLMTPTGVAELVVESLCPCGVAVDVRDRDWIEMMKMNAFLAIARGSCEPPLFLEMSYCGGNMDAKPVVLVGKGITFDTGGLCLKPCPNMSEYRADLAGGAVVMATMKCIAGMALPINVIGLVPLCENMVGGMAAKPGDVVIGRNGKTITIENTDFEGRVVMADALSYAEFHKPCLTISVASLTSGVRRTLGTSSSATFTTTSDVWRELHRAGGETGDRLWRMPFWKIYSKRVTDFLSADIHNVGLGKGQGVCLAAAFMKEFRPAFGDFVHIDITGTGFLSNGVGHPYLRENTMSGRPTRTLIQFIYQLACPHERGDEC